MATTHKGRVLVRCELPDGTVHRWCSAHLDPSGCVVQDGGADAFWEPRLLEGSVVGQDVGGVLGGYPQPVPQRLVVAVNRGDPQGTGYADLYALAYPDSGSPQRFDGSKVTVYYGTVGDTVAAMRIVFVGRVRRGGGLEWDLTRDRLTLSLDDASVVLDAVIGGDVWSTADHANIPESWQGVIKPVALGGYGSTGQVMLHAVGLDIVATPGTHTLGLGDPTPGTISGWGVPQAVWVDGVLVTAASPVTSSPGADEWGSWDPATLQFQINDQTIGLTDQSVVRVWVEGVAQSGVVATHPGDVLRALFAAAGLTQPDATMCATWTTTLEAVTTERTFLRAAIPQAATSDPVHLLPVVQAAMRRTLSVLRGGPDYDEFGPVYPDHSSPAARTLVEEELLRFRVLEDPYGEHAARVWLEDEEAGFEGSVPTSAQRFDSSTEATAYGRTDEVSVDVAPWMVGRWYWDPVTGTTLVHDVQWGSVVRDLLAQRLPWVEASVHVAALGGTLPKLGESIYYDTVDLRGPGVGHIRAVRLDVHAGVVTLRSFHGAWPAP